MKGVAITRAVPARAMLGKTVMHEHFASEAYGRSERHGGILPMADDECKHGRLAGDSTPPCGCWRGEKKR